MAKVTLKDYEGIERPTWCPGCGDYGILAAVKQALVSLDIAPHEIMMVSGIGCGSKLPHYMAGNEFNSVHGRALPVATGIHLANHSLKVLVICGDGDSYGIGGNHFMHAARRNVDIVHIPQNNQVYGLTTGQFSPTSDLGYASKTSPGGTIEQPVNPIALALAAGATFVSRSFAGDPKHLAGLIAKAIQHRGYALVDSLQPCVVWNKKNTYDWFRERIYKLEEQPDYNPSDRDWAWKKAQEWGDRIPIGIFYQAEGRLTLEEQIPALKEGPLVFQDLRSKVVQDAGRLRGMFM
jgi:2-oxoglutarate ferredoxin oxidoreductase subunit beta